LNYTYKNIPTHEDSCSNSQISGRIKWNTSILYDESKMEIFEILIDMLSIAHIVQK